MRDFPRYGEWSSNVESVRELGDDRVEFLVDAKVRKVRYVLQYFFDEPSRVIWTHPPEYVEGDIRSVEGEYRFEEVEPGLTRMTYRLTMDPGAFLPGPIKKVLVNVVMKGSVEDLKRHVESS